jgi:catechol 2,3-dioxygenase-like lactoylglutathione lyase family enzyme
MALIPELIVSDFVRSLEFYTRLLKFRMQYTRREERFAMLERDGGKLMIEQPVGRGFVLGELRQPYGRGVNFEIGAPDAIALYTDCVAAGAPIYVPLEQKSYQCGDELICVHQFVIQDPDGYLLRFSRSDA